MQFYCVHLFTPLMKQFSVLYENIESLTCQEMAPQFMHNMKVFPHICESNVHHMLIWIVQNTVVSISQVLYIAIFANYQIKFYHESSKIWVKYERETMPKCMHVYITITFYDSKFGTCQKLRRNWNILLFVHASGHCLVMFNPRLSYAGIRILDKTSTQKEARQVCLILYIILIIKCFAYFYTIMLIGTIFCWSRQNIKPWFPQGPVFLGTHKFSFVCTCISFFGLKALIAINI